MEKTLDQDGTELTQGNMVCFVSPEDEYEESALLVIVECRETRILVSDIMDINDKTAGRTKGIVPTRVLRASEVLKVA